MPDDQQNPLSDHQSSTPAEPSPTGTAQAQNQNAGSAQTNGEEYLQLKAELEATQTKLQEMVIISQRALADLQNFRRRSEEEKASFIQYANTELILDLLPVLDNVHRALAYEPKDENWQKGVEQTMKQFAQVLEKRHLATIEPVVGQKFDTALHEALLVGPGEKDVVIAELEKGYKLGEKVIKRARVKVGNGETAEA